jgi:hypothetical protein
MSISENFSHHLRKFSEASAITLLVLAYAGGGTATAQTLPLDAAPNCPVSASTFASWFQSGMPALNGVVNPANSVSFPATPNCSFYEWSEQMFFWLTSPTPPFYGSGSGAFVFDSPAFFDVSPLDATFHRTLLQHTPGFIRPLGVRVAQLGPANLRVVFDKTGQMFTVAPLKAAAAPAQVRDATGNLRTIAHVELGAQGALVLRDAKGSVIAPRVSPNAAARAARPAAPTIGRQAAPIINRPITAPVQVRSFIVDKIPIFIDPIGNVIDVEQGQADTGDVLMSQNNSLVYYATMVNDVYAYFLTGWRHNLIQPNTPNPTFPTTLSDLNAITSFAASHGVTFPDPDALAVEIKTAWVEASSLTSTNGYITMTATIPTYTADVANTTWTPSGQKTVLLALVGVHVVGSTNQHPEMVWATFEHVGNTPLAAYSYINKFGVVTPVAQSTGGSWLFSSGSAGPFNKPHMNEVSAVAGIAALGSFQVTPSDTIRWKPFGAASNVAPNPLVPNAAASNSDIISINNSISTNISTTMAGDVRGNYIFSGATWAIPGAPGPSGSGVQVGTSQLDNSTMETYDQGSGTTSGGASCLDCHNSVDQTGNINPNTFSVGISHIFFAINPLF